MLLKYLPKLILILLLLGIRHAQDTATQRHIQGVIQTLPEYSWVRYELQNGMLGGGQEQPYMERMRQVGVRRAFYKLTCRWQHGKPQDIQIIRRLYFNKYDGPHAQITEQKSLEAIRTTGLEAFLDQVAIEEAKNAPLRVGIHHPAIPHPEGKRMYIITPFFDDPVIHRGGRPWGMYDNFNPRPLSEAAQVGDVRDLESLLQVGKLPQRELNDALFSAVTNYYDNSDVIDLLLKAGADINARDSAGETPLMIATGRPIEAQALIERGADVNVRDHRGNIALRLAGNGPVGQLLRQAGARE